ncbi:hypothetical protein H0E84_08760 [Luteimonas sp. SJ-92]|uniref:Uncharacterized protein n=1 Tax=Luteimonas salinisoli TaxID=2752307 RepID=A0A853JB60_9GAMM|nr:hypothetical protein [Luteimonas salinisoli]NZA26476.1 hypothetical protein [Luteimonas salinisoli]
MNLPRTTEKTCQGQPGIERFSIVAAWRYTPGIHLEKDGMSTQYSLALGHPRARVALRAASIAAACLFFAIPAPALACQVVGMFNPGPGAAPTPICAGHNAPAGSSSSHAGPGLIDIVQARIRRYRAARDRRRAMEADPDYQAYMRGAWSYFDSGPPTDGGPRRCGASFMKEARVIMLFGDAAPGSMAMLTFVDLDSQRSRIPRVTEPQLVPVSLDQTGAPRADVRAYNHEMGDAGAITFAVPSLEAGIDGLVDTLRTRVRLEGREIFDLEYHSGLEAQAKLRGCLGSPMG